MGSSNASRLVTVRPFQVVHLSPQLAFALLRNQDLFDLRFQRPHFLCVPPRLGSLHPGLPTAAVRVPCTPSK
jgi:hypothetical protein